MMQANCSSFPRIVRQQLNSEFINEHMMFHVENLNVSQSVTATPHMPMLNKWKGKYKNENT